MTAAARTTPGIAIVGLGMAAAPHVKALLDLQQRVSVRAVFAPSAQRRNDFAQRYGFAPVESVAAIVDDPDIDIVLLLTPPNARSELVQQFAASGKHILMEKPVERTTVAATALVECCAAHRVALGIVFQHRYREASIKLRELIAGGTLGAIATVQLNVPWWRDQAYYDEPGRGSYERDGGGVLISQAIHSLDLMLSLTGPVSEVQALAGRSRLHRLEAEDFVAGGLRFANGALGMIAATTAAYPGGAESLRLDCEQASVCLQSGLLRVDWRDGTQQRFGSSSATGAGADPMAFPHDWHKALLEDFVDAVQRGQPAPVSGAEALRVHRLIDALLLSSQEQRAVSVVGDAG